jgi:glycine cleavage system transcriptional repressor
VTTVAITVIGRDRPGIIAEVTAVLAREGMNLEDSTMTLLRGHFAWVLVCSGPPDPARLEAALAPVTSDGSLLVWVRPVPPDADAHAAGGNITDLTTRLVGGLYVAVAEVTLPDTADPALLAGALAEVGRHLSVDVVLRPQDADLL